MAAWGQLHSRGQDLNAELLGASRVFLGHAMKSLRNRLKALHEEQKKKKKSVTFESETGSSFFSALGSAFVGQEPNYAEMSIARKHLIN